MDIQDIIKEALSFPSKTYVGWIVITALLIINAIMTQVIATGSMLAVIAYIISAIVCLFVLGLNISIMRNSIHGNGPNFNLNLGQNIGDGIKSIIISIVYAIIPAIILYVVAWISGLPTAISNLVIESSSIVNDSVVYTGLNTASQATVASAFTSISITVLFALILIIIFELLESVARATLADTGSISAALNIMAVVAKIRSIGVFKYIGFAVVMSIITIILGIVVTIIGAIPYIGSYIATIVTAYIVMIDAYAYGLIYTDGY
ncbi:DUF4013 domain-containing protein [Methanosphaera sp.]